MEKLAATNKELLEENSALKEQIQALEKSESDLKRNREAMMVSEEHYRLQASNIPDIIYSLDGEGNIVNVNSSAFERYGYSEQAAKGRPFLDFVHPEDREILINSFLKAIEDKRKVTTGLQFRIMAADGVAYWFELNAHVHFDSHDRYIGEEGVLRDITDRKCIENDLKESETLFQRMVESISDVIYKIDHQGVIIYFSPIGKDVWGYDKEDVIGKSFIEFVHPDDKEKLINRFIEFGTGVQKPLVYRLKNKAGEFKWVRTKTKPRIENGVFAGATGTLIDITDLKQAEDALRQSEAHYHLLADHMRDTIWLMDMNLKTTYRSPSAYKQRGYTLEEFQKLPIDQNITPASLALAMETFKEEMPKVLADPTYAAMRTLELEFYCKDGTTIFAECTFSLIRDESGKPQYFLCEGRDITERKQAEFQREAALKAVRESETLLRISMERAPDGVYMNDLEGNFLYGNSKAEEIIGYRREDLLGRNFLDFNIIAESSLGKAVELLEKNIEGRPTGPDELEMVRKDGRHILIEINTTVIYRSDKKVVLAFVRDITERKRVDEEKAKLENQLLQAQKMEAIGTLAGGVAHDFNNILSAIIGYAEMAVEEDSNEIRKKYLQETLNGAERAKKLVRQILTFSRQDSHEKKPLDIKILIKETVKFLRSSISSAIEIRQQITDESCNILADPTQMHQFIMNLCTNAAHAMKRTGGILNIELSNVELAQGDLPHLPDLQPGHYVKLAVSDTGHGIDPDNIQRIFDPFFTTKSKDEGTGLGLSVVFGIVKSHGGFINVASKLDQGATFNVYLPGIIHEEITNVPIQGKVIGGKERILFVDDEPALVDMGKRMLSSLGYDVTGVLNSVDAMNLFYSEPQRFDLVITDMTLPKMNGIVLSRKILKIRPEIPIILCSGIREDSTEEQARALGIRSYLTKPLTKRELAHAIRQALEKG